MPSYELLPDGDFAFDELKKDGDFGPHKIINLKEIVEAHQKKIDGAVKNYIICYINTAPETSTPLINTEQGDAFCEFPYLSFCLDDEAAAAADEDDDAEESEEEDEEIDDGSSVDSDAEGFCIQNLDFHPLYESSEKRMSFTCDYCKDETRQVSLYHLTLNSITDLINLPLA